MASTSFHLHEKPIQNTLSDNVIKEAIDVLKIEAEGILHLIEQMNDNFVRMASVIYQSSGRVIVGGIGKSGIIGRKLVATLNSTGTRSLFLHPVEAMHGDLGIVSSGDIFLALSYSGETDELNILIPRIRAIGCTIIAFTGNNQSTLAKHSDIVINVRVPREACPLGLAPTASTTAMLAMCDALAVVLINKRHFNSSDFKRIHPGGSLGQRLSKKIKDMMQTGKTIPKVYEKTRMEDAICEINRVGIGVTLVVKPDNMLSGIITDGDLRRALAQKLPIFNLFVEDIMTKTPLTMFPDTPARDALYLMEQHEITILPITDSAGRVQGILHLHDILGKGSFKFNE